jgi:tetratricopeptide (TPR) repeat protein
MIDFDFRVKGIVLTAAALGVLALSGGSPAGAGKPLRVSLRGGRGFLLSTGLAFALAILLWRGSYRPMLLWEYAEVAEAKHETAGRLADILFRLRRVSSPGRRPGGPVPRGELLAALEEAEAFDELAGPIRAVRDAVDSGGEDATRDAVGRLSAEVRQGVVRSLRRSWKFLERYLDMEPGDERIVARLVSVAGRIRPWVAPAEADRREREAEAALVRLTRLAPDSFNAWRLAAEFHADRGRMTQAAECYRKAAEAYPVKPELWLLRGDALASFDREAARRAYARAFDANRLAVDERRTLFARLWLSPPSPPRKRELPFDLDRADEALGRTAEVAWRRGFMYASAGGLTDAAEEFGKALEMRPGDCQLAAWRAVALEMEAARSGTGEARRGADAAWDDLAGMQASAPPERRLAEAALGLIQSRKGELARAARGER